MTAYARKLSVVVALGTAMRLLWVLVVHRPIDHNYSDMQGYTSRAQEFAEGVTQASTSALVWYIPSGTSAALSVFLRVFGFEHGWTAAAVAQALLSAACIWLVAIAARRFFGERAALTTAALLAVHYLAISYTGYFLSETWLAFAIAAAFATLVPGHWRACLCAGIFLGLGAWMKPQALVLAPLWAAWLLWTRRGPSAAMLVAGALAVVVPVSAFVSSRTGEPTFLSRNGGQTFAISHCPVRVISSTNPRAPMAVGLPETSARAGRGEAEAAWPVAEYTESFMRSAFYYGEGWACIRRDPAYAVQSSLRHVADVFAGPPWSNVTPWPDAFARARPEMPAWMPLAPFRIPAQASNLFVSYLVAPFALFAAWRRRRDEGTWLLVVLPMASVLAVSVLFHGESRFRVPYDVCLFVAAAAEWPALAARARRVRWRPHGPRQVGDAGR